MDINIETLKKIKGIGTKTLERIIEQHNIDNGIKSFKSEYKPSEIYSIKENINLWRGDCIELMSHIPDKSVDMVLCDLPYGTTQNTWDEKINFKKLWEHYKRIVKKKGAIVLFGGGGAFAKLLYSSNPSMYKYSWFWDKGRGSGFLNASKQPLRNIEEILVFYNEQPLYNPQFWEGAPLHGMGSKFRVIKNKNHNYGGFDSKSNPSAERKGDTKKFPLQLLEFSRPHPPIHPTQKPVELGEYLIKTYTNEGMAVMDNTMGVGSFGVSAKKLNRRFIGIELNQEYFDIAKERIAKTK